MEQNIKNLASAVLLQAAKDYCAGTEKEQAKISEELRSEWMQELTQGISLVVAEQLEKNWKSIAPRLEWDQQNMV